MRPQRTLSILLGLSGLAIAQQNQPELIGSISFNVQSSSGRVETFAVTVGDGGRGPYKAILAGDSTLPTHTIYRPRDLSPFSGSRLLPVIAFGNGGCRNTSGEFRNFLSDIASHGYLVVAIGPAGDSLIGGSEARVGQTLPRQLLDGVDWATQQNQTAGSEYYHRLDLTKVAVMGQSCGTGQAIAVSGDPRVTTTVLMNGGGAMLAGRGGATPPANPAPAQPAAATESVAAALDRMNKRYAPYAPPVPMASMAAASAASGPVSFHGPVAFINGGPSDSAYNGAKAAYEALDGVPAMFAYQEVGHYPATYREPNGGAFAVLAVAWLDWTLKGDQAAMKSFAGSDCGLCADPKWKIQSKRLPK